MAEVEVVDFLEDNGEGSEPGVEKAVDESNIEIEKEDYGLRKVESKKSDQNDHKDFSSSKIFTLISGSHFRFSHTVSWRSRCARR